MSVDGLLAYVTQDERSTEDIDSQVAIALRRRTGDDYHSLTEIEQGQVRSAFSVFDLFCSGCGDGPERTYLPPTAEEWTCDRCSA